MAWLRMVSGELKGKTFPVDRDRVTIGRASENAIALDDASVSGKHCEILRDGRAFTLHDLSSTNGTFLNDVRVFENRLSPKDIVRVGSFEMLFDGPDVEPFDPTAKGVDATRIVLPEAGRQESAPPPVFGVRHDRHWMWGILIVVIAMCVVAALSLFLVRLAGL